MRRTGSSSLSGALETAELQHRFGWRYTTDGLDIRPVFCKETEMTKLVREFNRAGPCITLGRFVRETQKFYVFNTWRGGDQFDTSETRISKRTPSHYSGAHVEPCSSCRDHPRTNFPNGYMD